MPTSVHLIFSANGNMEVVVSTLEDDEMEATEDFTISITVISGGPVDVAVNIATVEITDNDGGFFSQLHIDDAILCI